MSQGPGEQLSLLSTFFAVGSPAKTSRPPDSAPASPVAAPACGSNLPASCASSGPESSSSKTSRAGRRAGSARSGTSLSRLDTEPVPSIFLPPTSARPIDADASSLWPTATSTDAKGSRRVGNSPNSNSGETLTDAIRAPNWATPCARDAKGASTRAARHGGRDLPTEVLYPTPTASRYGSGQNGCPHDGREAFSGKGAPSLDTMAARLWGGTLNPDWVECLMGFPPGWTRLPLPTLGLPGVD
jgi:hypothetical protein